jgi:hypothetical protein
MLLAGGLTLCPGLGADRHRLPGPLRRAVKAVVSQHRCLVKRLVAIEHAVHLAPVNLLGPGTRAAPLDAIIMKTSRPICSPRFNGLPSAVEMNSEAKPGRGKHPGQNTGPGDQPALLHIDGERITAARNQVSRWLYARARLRPTPPTRPAGGTGFTRAVDSAESGISSLAVNTNY